MNWRKSFGFTILFLVTWIPATAVDQNANQQSDVWEMVFEAFALPPGDDMDADGWSNASESTTGTDPLDANSHPGLEIRLQAGLPILSWPSVVGKHYLLTTSGQLNGFVPEGDAMTGTGAEMELQLPPPNGSEFFRTQINDGDADGDGVNDWEELTVGFDPGRANTDRYSSVDSVRVAAGLAASNTISVSVYDDPLIRS
jgi:hypothetical protein